MEKDIAEGKLGSVGEYDLEFKGGKLSFKLKADVNGLVQAGLSVEVPAHAVFAAIKKAIPGQVDDYLLDAAEAVLVGG